MATISIANKEQESAEAISSVDRIFKIMELLSERSGLSVAEIAHRVDIARPTVHRLLKQLQARGYVKKENNRGGFSLTLKIIELGKCALNNLSLVNVAIGQMYQLREQFDEAVDLSVLEETSSVVVHAIPSTQLISPRYTVGMRGPCHCSSSGKALLAWQPLPVLQSLLDQIKFESHTSRTTTKRRQLELELESIRKQGIAHASEEQLPHLHSMSAPVFNLWGDVIAALSITFPQYRFNRNLLPDYEFHLKATALSISEGMGYKQPEL